MRELPESHYDRIRPLIETCGKHGHLAFVYEVLEGRKPGPVFVDQPDHPRTAVVCNPTGFFFGFGDFDPDHLPALLDHLWERKLDQDYASLYCYNDAWVRPLGQLLEPRGAQQTVRLAFKLEQDPGQLPQPDLPEGYRLAPIDPTVAQSVLDGTGTSGFGIDPWFIRIRGGPEGYCQPGLGKVILHEGQIASLCGYCALGGGEAELEVGTVHSFSRRGLAQMVSGAFMRQCVEKNWQPAYTCSDGNLASAAVAKRLGYVFMEKIIGYSLYPG